MNYSRIEKCGISNLTPVFGRGLRGETWAAARNRQWVDSAVEMGVRRMIDLRTSDHNDKLLAVCQQRGIEYYHFPVDSSVQDPVELARELPILFRLIDEDGFYISCQQGLHRTDIALALYYFFHDDAEIPLMYGHRKDGAFRCDDILRRINSMRSFFPSVTNEMFRERREKFLAYNRKFEDEWVERYGANNLADRLAGVAKAQTLPAAVLCRRKRRLLDDAAKGECWFSSKSLYVDVFSNFHPCLIVLDGVTYPSAEHAYQAHKFPVGSVARQRLMEQETGSDVKSLASHLRSEMRSDWDEHRKLAVMRKILNLKVGKHDHYCAAPTAGQAAAAA